MRLCIEGIYLVQPKGTESFFFESITNVYKLYESNYNIINARFEAISSSEFDLRLILLKAIIVLFVEGRSTTEI